MENNELLKSAKKLQKEAKRAVDEIGIFPILERISEPSIVGSVRTGLMVWPDIDIHARVEKLKLNDILNLLKEFTLLPTIQKVQFSNFRELRRDNIKGRMTFPYGYYIGLRSIQLLKEWKIDIWFIERGKEVEDYNVADLLDITKEQKIAILRIKKAWLSKKAGYRDGIISTDIYKAVLKQGIMDETDFENYINKK